jgi:hypothetical protein
VHISVDGIVSVRLAALNSDHFVSYFCISQNGTNVLKYFMIMSLASSGLGR